MICIINKQIGSERALYIEEFVIAAIRKVNISYQTLYIKSVKQGDVNIVIDDKKYIIRENSEVMRI